MSKPSLRALILEDSEDDMELLLRELRRGFDVVHGRVQTAEAMREALRESEWNIVLSDYSMPDFDAIEALSVLHESTMDLPFIVISGTIGEETAVGALKAGAHDFLVKGRLARLLPAITRELREREVRAARRRAEDALREGEVKYRRIVETAREGIWVIDAEGRTTFANARMAEMLGTTPEKLEGMPIFDFMEDAWKIAAVRNLERGRQGVAEQFEFNYRRLDGTSFWAALSTNPIVDEAGRHIGALAMVTDITEQRKLQTQLLMSDRMASVGMLAAGIAHEINNPLTAVTANLELGVLDLTELKNRLPGEHRISEVLALLGDAQSAAEHLRQIVRDVKIFSRAEEEAMSCVDVERVLESSIRMVWNEIRHRARLMKDYGAIPPVEANESRLGQVFLNLLVNAAQAIPEGRADSHEIRAVTRTDAEGRAVIEIHDTGTGMTPDVQRRLFVPFFTTKPSGVGTGLGLSICHRIVSSFGGRIEVSSEAGRGSTFRIVLPPAAPAPALEASPAERISRSTRRGRVLVIDDEPSILQVTRRALAPEHDVTSINDGTEALALIRAGERFDVILCDLMMPHVTGIEVYTEILWMAPEQAEKMVFMTGGAFTPSARTFLDEVPNTRMGKPFSVQELRAVVNARVL